MSSVVRATISERRIAETNAKAINAASRLPITVSGRAFIICTTCVAVMAAFCSGAVPKVRLIPRRTARRPSEAVGRGSMRACGDARLRQLVGQSCSIEAKVVPFFKAGRELFARVNRPAKGVGFAPASCRDSPVTGSCRLRFGEAS